MLVANCQSFLHAHRNCAGVTSQPEGEWGCTDCVKGTKHTDYNPFQLRHICLRPPHPKKVGTRERACARSRMRSKFTMETYLSLAVRSTVGSAILVSQSTS